MTTLRMPTLPSASEVREFHGCVAIGAHRVRYESSRDTRFRWLVEGPVNAAGKDKDLRDFLDDFATYREAVQDARARERAIAERRASAITRLAQHAPKMLDTLDRAIDAILGDYHGDSHSTMSLEEWSELLWEMIETSCKARGKKRPRTLPEHWTPEPA